VIHAPKPGDPDRWVAHVFIGRDATGRPIQKTRVLHGSNRSVARQAAELERSIRGVDGSRVVPALATTATASDLFRE
jgi:hypothetical protein